MPNSMRPLLMRSIVATSLAIQIGSRWATRVMPVPSIRFSVTAAAAASGGKHWFVYAKAGTYKFSKPMQVDDDAVKSGRAEDVMTPLPFTIDSDATLLEASKVMVEQRVHRLLVTHEGALKGIVSTIDILRGLTEHEG